MAGGDHVDDFRRLLGEGDHPPARLRYAVQEGEGGVAAALKLAREFAAGEKICVILGDNIIERHIRWAAGAFRRQPSGAKLLLKEVDDPRRFCVARVESGRIVEIVDKPADPPSNLAVTCIYKYDESVFDIADELATSARGELEITDLNNRYVRRGDLTYEILEGWWTDAGNFATLHEAACLVARSGANNVEEPAALAA